MKVYGRGLKYWEEWVRKGKPLSPEDRFWEPWKHRPRFAGQTLKAWSHPNKPEEQPIGKQHRTRRAAAWLKGRTAMDAGCGMGHLYGALQDLIDDYCGVDCKAMIELARTCWLGQEKKFRAGDLLDLSGQKGWGPKFGVFDTVFSLQVFQHLPVLYEPLQQLWEHSRLATVVTLLPLGESKIRIMHAGTIMHYYTREEVEAVIESLSPKPASFEILDTQEKEFPEDSASAIEKCIVRINKEVSV